MTTPKIKPIDRKRISEALLADRLGLNEEWIERWEKGGKWKEESAMPDLLPAFILNNYYEKEIRDIKTEVERLVGAGCRRRVVYFCLVQLSPEATWWRAGGEKKPVFKIGRTSSVADAEYFVDDKTRLATREDLESVANAAKTARKQIHRYQRELFLVAESSSYPLPASFEYRSKTAIEALDFLLNSLTWTATLADAYTAPMETTLLKSKGLLYLTCYVYKFAENKKLRSPKLSFRDGSRPSGMKRARAERAVGDPLTNLLNILVKEQGEAKGWSPSELHGKLNGFREDHPRLYKKLAEKLKELHDFAAR